MLKVALDRSPRGIEEGTGRCTISLLSILFILEISEASALDGNHAGAHRVVGMAHGLEKRTLRRGPDRLENLPAKATRMLPGGFNVHLDPAGVHGTERVLETTAAPWDPPEPSPQGLILLKGLLHFPHGHGVALITNNPGILVLDRGLLFFNLVHQHPHGLQKIERLKACNDRGSLELLGDELKGLPAKDGAHMAR